VAEGVSVQLHFLPESSSLHSLRILLEDGTEVCVCVALLLIWRCCLVEPFVFARCLLQVVSEPEFQSNKNYHSIRSKSAEFVKLTVEKVREAAATATA
jgi:hypothetical protein